MPEPGGGESGQSGSSLVLRWVGVEAESERATPRPQGMDLPATGAA